MDPHKEALAAIMKFLDGQELEGLKKHSPKLIAVTMAEKPKDAEKPDEKAAEDDSPLKDLPEDLLASLLGDDGESQGEESPEEPAEDDDEKLKALAKKLGRRPEQGPAARRAAPGLRDPLQGRGRLPAHR